MADIYWKTGGKDWFGQGLSDFFSEVNPSKNRFFSCLTDSPPAHRQVVVLACLPQDQQKFSVLLNQNAQPWLNFLISFSESTSFFSPFPWTEQVFSHPVSSRGKDTEYIKIAPDPDQNSSKSSLYQENIRKPDLEYRLKNPYLPALLYDADRIISIACIQDSFSFGMFNTLSSLFFLLPTITQVEILLLQSASIRSQALVQAVSPLLQKMSFTLQVNLAPTSFVIASNDPLSADAYSAMMNSVKVSSLPYLKMASKKQLGVSDLLMIHNRSERFRKPINQKRIKWSARSSVQFDSNCTLCGQCITMCPLQALSLGEDRQMAWDSSRCNRCGLCLDICPENAIKS